MYEDSIDKICEDAAIYAYDWQKARGETLKLKGFSQRFGKRVRKFGMTTVEALKTRPDLLEVAIDPKGLGYLVYSIKFQREHGMIEPEQEVIIQEFLKAKAIRDEEEALKANPISRMILKALEVDNEPVDIRTLKKLVYMYGLDVKALEANIDLLMSSNRIQNTNGLISLVKPS